MLLYVANGNCRYIDIILSKARTGDKQNQNKNVGKITSRSGRGKQESE